MPATLGDAKPDDILLDHGRASVVPTHRRCVRVRMPTVAPPWSRAELHTGEMWNSNSVTARLTAASGLPTDDLRPPPRGRAPGWDAGLETARRSAAYDRVYLEAPQLTAAGG
jgi:hypothetical protein